MSEVIFILKFQWVSNHDIPWTGVTFKIKGEKEVTLSSETAGRGTVVSPYFGTVDARFLVSN